MKRLAWIAVVPLLLASCIDSASVGSTVHIVVSGAFADEVDLAAPPESYRFIGNPESRPMSAEEMTETALVVCGAMEQDADLRLMAQAASEAGAPSFAKVIRVFSNSSIVSEGCGGLSLSQNISLRPTGGGGTVEFQKEVLPCGRDTPEEELIASCLSALEASPKGVILAGRGMRFPDSLELVEIVFRPAG
jgi:hypothetical protein